MTSISIPKQLRSHERLKLVARPGRFGAVKKVHGIRNAAGLTHDQVSSVGSVHCGKLSGG
jgi:hypothetical protein